MSARMSPALLRWSETQLLQLQLLAVSTLQRLCPLLPTQYAQLDGYEEER